MSCISAVTMQLLLRTEHVLRCKALRSETLVSHVCDISRQNYFPSVRCTHLSHHKEWHLLLSPRLKWQVLNFA